MKTIFSALKQAYHRWRFVEDVEDGAKSTSRRGAVETPEEEVRRLRSAIDRERRNAASFRKYDCNGLAAPCESSIKVMESRIRALELTLRRAV